MVAENLKLIIQVEVAKAIAELKKTTEETKKTSSEFQKFREGIDKFSKTILASAGVVYAIQKLRQAFKYGLESAKIAAEANQISNALDSMAKETGTSANEIVAALKKASGGTVSELDLMKSASKAALFNLPMDQLGRLMEIARASATATGESVQFMFDSIVTGIARGSPMILDNLGLTLKIGEATEKYAQSIGKTTEELTAEERKMATLNATLEAGGKIIDKVNASSDELTALQKWQKYEATMKDLRLEIGKFMVPAFASIVEEATRFATKLKDIVELRNIMRAIGEGSATTTDRLRAVNIQLEQMNDQLQTVKGRPGGDPTSGIIKQRIIALQKEQEWLKKAQYYESLRTAESMGAAREAKRMAEEEAARAEQAMQLLAEIDKAYGKTPEGARAALEAQVAMWEGHLESAGSAAPKIRAIIADLREELDGMTESARMAVSAWAAIPEQKAGVGAGASAGIRLTSDAAAKAIELYKEWIGETQELTVANDQFGRSLEGSGEAAKIAEKRFEEIKIQVDMMRAAITPFAEAFGAMIVNAKDGAEAFKEAMKGAFAAVLEMLAKEAFVRAAAAFASMNFAGAALWTAAGTAALVAAGAVKAMAEGGIVTKPTHALIGERGPEAVIPLNRAGNFGTVVINVQGSVLAEEDLSRKVLTAVRRAGRGY